MQTIIVRSIGREYRIRTPSAEIAGFLAFIDARPEIAGPPLAPVEIAAEPVADGFRLTLPAGERLERSAVEAANAIHEATFSGVQEEAPGAPLVHGASLVMEGRRVLVVGEKGAGKSTLTLHLLSRGFEVEGDEHVVLRENDLIARPRRMRVKPGSLPFVPALAEAVLGSPMVQDPFAGPVYAVDPAVAGRPWRIAPGRADLLVFLAPNHGGGSTMTPIGPEEAFRGLAEHCLLPSTGQGAASARLYRLAAATPAARLSVGDLGEAEAALRSHVTKKQRR